MNPLWTAVPAVAVIGAVILGAGARRARIATRLLVAEARRLDDVHQAVLALRAETAATRAAARRLHR